MGFVKYVRRFMDDRHQNMLWAFAEKKTVIDRAFTALQALGNALDG